MLHTTRKNNNPGISCKVLNESEKSRNCNESEKMVKVTSVPATKVSLASIPI